MRLAVVLVVALCACSSSTDPAAPGGSCDRLYVAGSTEAQDTCRDVVPAAELSTYTVLRCDMSTRDAVASERGCKIVSPVRTSICCPP